MQHLVARSAEGTPVAFLSYLATQEPDCRDRLRPVLYCYELQVSEGHRGGGLGSRLLGMLEEEARRRLRRPIVMLTCFARNTAALRFYHRHGYRPDPISPSECCRRPGDPPIEYEILSKALS